MQYDLDPASKDGYEPPAKRSKGKGEAKKRVGKRNKMEEIVKPPLLFKRSGWTFQIGKGRRRVHR